MTYEYYTEPCQHCIERAKVGRNTSRCGWCDSNGISDSRASRFPGEIIKIPKGSEGYPYHRRPHPERRYYKNGRHIVEMDGHVPNDKTDNVSERTVDERFGFFHKVILSIFLSIAIMLSFKTGFYFSYENLFLELIRVLTGLRPDASGNINADSMSLSSIKDALIYYFFVYGWFALIVLLIIRNTGRSMQFFSSGNSPLFVLFAVFFFLPLIRYHFL